MTASKEAIELAMLAPPEVQHKSKHYWECPSCCSRYFPDGHGFRNLSSPRHPICVKCFQYCSEGHWFGYGERCNLCRRPRRRVNMIRHAIPDNDPTFGLTSTGSNTYPVSNFGYTATQTNGLTAGYLNVTQAVLSEPATVYEMVFYAHVASASCKVGIYDDSSSAPNNLVVGPVEFTPTVLNTWETKAVTRTYLAAGTYWLGDQGNTTGYCAYDSTAGTQKYKALSYGTAWPNPAGSGWTGPITDRSCLYVNYHKIKGYIKGYKFQCTDATGSLVDSFSIFAYWACNYRMALYNDDGGSPSKPHLLLWSSNSTAASENAWLTIVEGSGTRANSWDGKLTLNAWYWLLWQTDTTTLAPSYTAGTTNYGVYLAQAYGAFPSTWSGGTNSAEEWSHYCTYELAVDTVSVSDVGSGADVITMTAYDTFAVSDTGAGVDAPTVQEGAAVSDVGAGVDAPTLSEDALCHETGGGVDVTIIVDNITLSDVGAGVDASSYIDGSIIFVYDFGIGLDVAYLVRGTISLDDVALPHVLVIPVDEPSIIQDLPVMDALPYRKQLGKKGRSLRIQGWTDSLTTLETLRGYDDGETHLLVLPTGDSMNVHVTDVRTPDKAETPGHYEYEMDAVEVID